MPRRAVDGVVARRKVIVGGGTEKSDGGLSHQSKYLQKRLASSAHRLLLLQRLSEPEDSADKAGRPRSRIDRLFANLIAGRSITVAAALLVLVVSGYVTVDTWMTNQRVKAAPVKVGTIESNNAAVVHEGGAADSTPLPRDALKNHRVAQPGMPRAIYIDSIKVAARSLPMGVDAKGSLQAPVSAFDAGWYKESSKPGAVGAALFDGHSSGSSAMGVFGKLATLDNGSIIRIEAGSGRLYNYRVVAKETVAKDKVDMKKAMLPYEGLRGANFITCAGSWVDDGSTLSERTVVYTVLVQ